MAQDPRHQRHHDALDGRLEHLESRIQVLEADLAARERGGGGPHFYESGRIHPELDDRAISP